MRGLVIFGLIVVLGTGCGPSTPPKAAPVSITGKVTDAAGKTLGNMMLSFAAQDAKLQDERPLAVVAADGTFTVSCVPGPYKVTLLPLPKSVGAAPDQGNITTPEKGKVNPAKSSLVIPSGSGQPTWDIVVKDGKNDPFALQVRPTMGAGMGAGMGPPPGMSPPP